MSLSRERLVLTVVILTVLGWRQTQAMQLELAQLVFRHGDRSAVVSFPTNPCDESCWRQGYGQLTQLGMRQHYMLGQYLSDRYRQQHGLINSSFYLRNELYVRSTDVDRTLMSAEALLSALYPPVDFQQFLPTLPWQPIPVHTVPKHNDSLLRAYDSALNICPRYTEIYNSQDQRPDYIEKTKKEQWFLDWVKEKSGMTFPYTLSNIYTIEDTLFCQSQHNLSLPNWVNQTVLNHLEELASYSMMSMFTGEEAHRLTSGLLIGEMLNHMVSKSNDTTSADKLYLYSAHDTTVAAFLCGLGISNGIQPPYASAVLVELYSDPQGFFVKVLYRNETSTISTELVDLTTLISGCTSSPCPLATFRTFAKTVVPDNWAEACKMEGSGSPSKNTNRIIIIGFSIGGVLIIVLFAVVIYVCRKRARGSYSAMSP